MLITKHTVMRGALAAIYHSRTHQLLSPITKGLGAVLMLHQVRPAIPRAFDPNGILRVTPDFLDAAIRQIKAEGYEFVAMDEAQRRLTAPAGAKPFVAVTLDDGYRDNLVHARPVFTRHNVPYCIYVPTSFADGRGDLWWENFEAAIAAGRPLTVRKDGESLTFDCATPEQQRKAWGALYWWLRGPDEDETRVRVLDLCAQAGVDPLVPAREMMTWDELHVLAADPLCTIGAHTVNHYSLAKLDSARCFEEMASGKQGLEDRLGCPVRHMSYPYGSAADCGPREFELAKEAGFETGVTTYKGLLFPAHRDHLLGLPRLSLNGEFQDLQMLSVLLGGAPFALRNGFRHVATA
jgi:peptidoglycan/xylan/chitin deacetylase (PgdA/CDA1 family)